MDPKPISMGELTIKELQEASGRIAKDHGFRDGKGKTFGEDIALIHSELSEALEEHRNGYPPTLTYYSNNGKLEGVPSELADAMIRIAEVADFYGIDLTPAIRHKMAYNESRPYRHGGKKL